MQRRDERHYAPSIVFLPFEMCGREAYYLLHGALPVDEPPHEGAVHVERGIAPAAQTAEDLLQACVAQAGERNLGNLLVMPGGHVAAHHRHSVEYADLFFFLHTLFLDIWQLQSVAFLPVKHLEVETEDEGQNTQRSEYKHRLCIVVLERICHTGV